MSLQERANILNGSHFSIILMMMSMMERWEKTMMKYQECYLISKSQVTSSKVKKIPQVRKRFQFLKELELQFTPSQNIVVP